MPFCRRPRTYTGCAVPGHLCCKILDKDDLSNSPLGRGHVVPSADLSVYDNYAVALFSRSPLDFPFPCEPAQRDLSPPFHSLKGAMSYPTARHDAAGYDLSLLDALSDPIVGNIHPRDPLSAAAPLSSGPLEPQLHTTQVEKPVCGPCHHPVLEVCKLTVPTIYPFSFRCSPPA